MPDTIVETDIPARLDRLPWGRFHTLVVAALGITWILDGLEVTLAGTVAAALKASPVLQFSNSDVGFAAAAYLAGAVVGALFFGWLTDRLGRKKLFFITLAVYLIATAATAFSWSFWSFVLFRFLTGAGIGGEYAAINSTIQELIPARVRGWTDLVINGSFWIGAVLGALGAIVLLDPAVLDPEYGWRLAFFIGAVLALVIFFMRLWLPESPRWLMTHGREIEAEQVVADIERRVYGAAPIPPTELPRVRLRARTHTPLAEVANTLLHSHRRRTLVGLALMAAQAFFYNAIFFTYALVLTDFYGISAEHVGWYILPFAAGNVLGPLLLGPLFDRIGRRVMITATYALPYNMTAGTLMQFASARPFNAFTGVDNNGDGANNDRPVVDGKVIAKSAFRGTGTQDVSMFVEGRIKGTGRNTLLLRLEGFNLFNHGNMLGRAQTTYGDTTTINNTFSQLVAVGTASNAIPALANIDPPRMFQLQVRFLF